jgi:hypothetical protein
MSKYSRRNYKKKTHVLYMSRNINFRRNYKKLDTYINIWVEILVFVDIIKKKAYVFIYK